MWGIQPAACKNTCKNPMNLTLVSQLSMMEAMGVVCVDSIPSQSTCHASSALVLVTKRKSCFVPLHLQKHEECS